MPAVRTRRRHRRHRARLRHQRLAGRRYRCARCGAIGLPSLGTRRLAEHATKLKVGMSDGDLPGRKVDPRR